ncbi:hypothetical protein GCM10010416_79080 [Streptomyces caniferus]
MECGLVGDGELVGSRSAGTARGRVRGLPGPVRGTRMQDITVSKAGASPGWPAVTVKTRGRARLTAARWTLVLARRGWIRARGRWARRSGSPPLERSGSALMGPDNRGAQ